MKKLYPNFFLFIVILFGLSCSKEESAENLYISTTVSIAVMDSFGNDLLNTNTANYIQSQNIKLFHKIDGEFIEYLSNNLDYAKGFRIYKPYDWVDNSNYILCILATRPVNSSDLNPDTYIKWNEFDFDTLQCQYSTSENSVICTKVWFNNEIVWDINEAKNNDPRWFAVVK